MTLPKFTEEEQTFIDHCYASTLHHFIGNPLKRDNPDHIREAINDRNYNIGQIGPENHKLMHSIFDKLGYCKDGKTTKDEEYQRQIKLEEEKVELWNKQRKIAIEDIHSKIAELKQLEQDLLNHDINFNKIVEEKAKVVKEQFQKEIKEKRKDSRNMLIRETQDQIDNMVVRELRVLASERGVKNYSRMNKAEMKQAIKETY